MDSQRLKNLYKDINNIILNIYENDQTTEREKFKILITKLENLFIETYTLIFTLENNDKPINFEHYDYFNKDIKDEASKTNDKLSTLATKKCFKFYLPRNEHEKRIENLDRQNRRLNIKIKELEDKIKEYEGYNNINFINK